MNDGKLKKILFENIDTEIFLAHESLGIFYAISENSDRLNTSQWKNLFGIIQRQALDGLVLSICKLFENQNKQYPNFSIPTALQIFRENLHDISAPINNILTFTDFIQATIDPNFDIKDQETIKSIPNAVCTYFENACPNIHPQSDNDLNSIYKDIRVLRDKRVAHHEDHDLVELLQTDMDGVIKLLCFAQTFANIVGYGFYGFSQKGIVTPEKFSPEKSEGWKQMLKMIQYIEST